ncbi:MAG TPA: hypothetical protein VHV27_04365 [Phenylobacterium sp.]|jgi:antitoxin (DNA-binding transcriptional repressor) of toxin-antitoxin stability system|nr:hypothetical protein [Phenylobacterium sp.]
MKQLDLDDLPPKIAALISELAEGDELVIVRHGAAVRRLVVGATPGMKPPAPQPEIVPDEHVKEVFEQFRSSVEDES